MSFDFGTLPEKVQQTLAQLHHPDATKTTKNRVGWSSKHRGKNPRDANTPDGLSSSKISGPVPVSKNGTK